MPDIPQEAVRLAAEVRLRQYGSEYSSAHLTWRDFADEAREVLEAAAVPLGEHVAAKITAHCDEHGPDPSKPLKPRVVLQVSMRRMHFQTAARIAGRAFLTEEDLLAMAAEAIKRGDFTMCRSQEPDDDE